MESNINHRDFLQFGLKHYSIEIEKIEGKFFHLKYNYLIEIEGPNLFKLLHEGQVVGPFGGVESLCEFIKQDIQLNYG
ncbi:MAG: hypothetical protein MRZ79_15440 [Bacteroidia bacterium]|nr:hypothetical protein [Bacteroidia bacterium]